MRAPLSDSEPERLGVSIRTRGEAASAASRVNVWGAMLVPPGACGAVPGLGCVGAPVWQDTFLSVPGETLHARYVDLFTGHEVVADRDRDRRQVCMADIFAYLPVAMLVPLT